MTLKVKTPPVAQISTADIKTHLRLYGDDSSEDSLLESYLLAAQEVARLETGRSIGSQTLELWLDVFPASAILLPYGPVASVTSVVYTDADGIDQTIADNLYVLDNKGAESWLVPVVNAVWPATKTSMLNSVKVEYVAGDLPNAVRQALLLMVAQMTANRGDLGELPAGVKYLLNTAKIRIGLA